MQIPTKIQHGEKVISTVFEKINGIIDYLNASKLRKSSGIDVRETPSGTVLELVQKSVSAPQAQQSTAVASGLEATVSGGTATVEISGSTALVIKPGANIQISGGTNGELIISATGGGSTGFPNYLSQNTVDNLAFFTVYGPFANNVWLIGKVFSVLDNDDLRGDLSVWIYGGTGSERIDVYNADIGPVNTFDISAFGSLVNLPISAGKTFELVWVSAEPDISNLKIYPCI